MDKLTKKYMKRMKAKRPNAEQAAPTEDKAPRKKVADEKLADNVEEEKAVPKTEEKSTTSKPTVEEEKKGDEQKSAVSIVTGSK